MNNLDDILLPTIPIDFLEIDYSTKMVRVDDQYYFSEKKLGFDTLCFFQDNRYRICKYEGRDLWLRYRYGECSGYFKHDIQKSPEMCFSSLLSNKNRMIVRYGLIINLEKDDYVLRKIDPAYWFNSKQEEPQLIHTSKKTGINVYKLREGLDFKKKDGKSFLVSIYGDFYGFSKNKLYIDECGRKHRFYSLEELKEIALRDRIKESAPVILMRELISEGKI